MQKKTEISKKMGDEYPARNHENNFGGITNIKITNNNVGAYPCGRQINVKTCGRPVNAKNYVRPINANVTHLSNNSELLMGKGVSNTTKTCSLLTNDVVGAHPCGRPVNEKNCGRPMNVKNCGRPANGINLSEKGADVKFGAINKFILFCTFLCIITLSTYAQTIIDQGNCGANGNNLTWVLTYDGVDSILTINGSGDMADYKNVVDSTAPWDSYKSQMTKLIIGDSVTSIGNYAFYNCGFTGNLTLPNSLISIGNSAFRWCTGFSGNLVIPNSVTTIGEYAFTLCKGFNGTLTIGNSVTTIGNSAFSGCENFTGNLIIPNSVKNIGIGAFQMCHGFTGTLTISNSVDSIGDNAFWGCSGFTGNLTIPDSVTYIGDACFTSCSGFDTLNFNAINCITMGNGMNGGGYLPLFSGCTSLKTLKIGSQVQNIPDNAFMACSTFLGNLTIPNSVIYIGDLAFGWCSGLTSLTIPNSVTYIGDSAFAGCIALASITSHAINPPNVGTDAFLNVSNTIPVYVPCGITSDYETATGWDYFSNYFDTLPLPTPTNLTVTQQNATLVVEWQNTGATNYEIYRNSTSFATVTTNTYTDTTVINGTNYCYQIKAVNGTNCESQLSEEICKTFNHTSIDNYQLETGNLQVYPNPTNGIITIICVETHCNASLHNDATIQIYDIIGHCVAQFSILNSPFSIDISHLQQGMYYLRIGNETVKIIKE